MRMTTQTRFPGRSAKRLTLFMSVHQKVGRHSLKMEILKRARKAKLAGATVFEGDKGFGVSGYVHRERLLSDDRPLAVVLIDDPGKIDAFLDEIDALLRGVVATVDDIEIVDL